MFTRYYFGWFLKPKLNKFDIYFKINLPLGLKVINVKNFHSKNLKRKFGTVFPTGNFIFIISYLCKERLNQMSFFFLFSTFFGKIYQLHVKVSIGEKSIY